MDADRFAAMAKALGSGANRRRVLGILLGGTVGGLVAGVPLDAAAKPDPKDKNPKQKKKGGGVCPSPRPCCNCYNDTGNTSCHIVSTQEECALLCNNATGGQYGYNDPNVIQPGKTTACNQLNQCIFVSC